MKNEMNENGQNKDQEINLEELEKVGGGNASYQTQEDAQPKQFSFEEIMKKTVSATSPARYR